MPGKHDPALINKVVNDEVSTPAPIYDPKKVQDLLGINEDIPYVQLDAFLGNPYSLLGSVVEVRKIGGNVPSSFASGPIEFSLYPIPGVKVDPASKLGSPILRQSIVVDQGIAANVAFLSYLSAEIDASSVFSVTVFDHAMGLADRQDLGWQPGVATWISQNSAIITDPDICYIFVIIGFVEKEIVRKKYVKFTGAAKGGAYGLNVNGSLHTSTEEYACDVRFGLTPAVIKRPAPTLVPHAKGVDGIGLDATRQELALFRTTSIIKAK
jgi:hypothetical protein